ncbi:O-antigen ligase [Flavobacterium sp. MK4S-17]|uniref:O-antigen ligase family protein n=1 Tax=Flavobacterium sp. MK4S-17 TaxID=2543737 RepID=UPI00135A87A9|nr:O-antigen ligase family protein [Flavobacterium sp. MK4S-17]
MKYDYKDFFVYKYDIPKFRDFVYNEITFFKIHPTYYTSIVVFIIAFSMDKILSEKKYSELLYILPLTFITFMVLSKLNIIFLGLLLIYMLIFRNNFSFRTKVVSVSTLFIVIITLALTVPGIKHRFREIYTSYNNPPKGLAYDSTNIRIALIKCNLEVAKENFITGIGFSDILNTLHECQSSNYDAGFYKNKKYLTHNYFFYILITTGIFGLLAFIYYCFIVVRKSIAINRFLLYVMLVNVFLVCLTEDFFYRHYGLFYFSLILMTFIGWYQQNNTTVNKKAL